MTHSRWIEIAAAALAGGLVGGGLVALVTPSGTAERDAAPTAAATVEPAWTAELATLTEEQAELRARVERLALRPAAAPRREPVTAPETEVTREEFDALRAEIARSFPNVAAPYGPSESAPVPLEERVKLALEQVRFEERVDKASSQIDQRRDRVEADVETLTERLDLSRSQADRMRDALLTHYEREAELVRRWEAGVDDELLGEAKTQMGQDFTADIQGFLGPDQLQGFWQTVKDSSQ